MKNKISFSVFLVILAFFSNTTVFAQNVGPLTDSLQKYQELIKNAATQEEKIRLALQLQKIIYGRSAVDTALITKMPSSKQGALKEKDKQLAEIQKQKQNIDTSKSRKDKYTAIQKLLAKNDSIIVANKNAGKHSGIQPGLITLPNADQFLMDPRATVDTSQVRLSCMYNQTYTHGKESFSASSTSATMYRQNGIIKIAATNDALPETVMHGNIGIPTMVNHHDLYGAASMAAGCETGRSDHKFAFSFYYNPASNQYAVGAGAGLLINRPCAGPHEPTTRTGGVGFSATNDASTWKVAGYANKITDSNKTATFAKTQTGFLITYNKSSNGITETFSAEISLSPLHYEAFIEAADTGGYRRWIPVGPTLTDYPTLPNKGKGNDIQLKVTLWDKITNKEASNNYKAVIKLNNVSNMPGYCMNFPENDKDADDKPDMRFDREDSSIYENWSQNSITTRNNSGPQYVTVVSYDYGGIADVTADVTTPDGFTIKAHLRTGTNDTLTLPKRTNGSFIADYWKQQQNAIAKSDTTDDEEIEIGDDRYRGDGLTLYEEYRGFLENRKHFRGNAEKKDIMVCNKIATARSQDGINMCEAVLNQYGNRVYMHSKFKDDEFGKKHDPDADEISKMTEEGVTTAMKYNRCINYKNIQSLHLIDQHGIVLMNSEEESGYAIAVKKTGAHLGPPKNMYFLVITKSFSPKPGAWSEIRGDIDEDGHITVTPQGKFKILTDEYAVTVAHEMLHCFHVPHHGSDNDFGQCSFSYDAFSSHWKVVAKDGKRLASPLRINLFWEGDPDNEIGFNDVDAVTATSWHVVGENSNHSGVEDCIMRYDNAMGYTRADWKNVYLLKSKTEYAELTGINICNSTIGSGVNSRNHKPISRYGDAAPGHGDCIHQFCVSDRYD